jgi:hypothetical protein
VNVNYISANGQVRGSVTTSTTGAYRISSLPGSIYTITPASDQLAFLPPESEIDITFGNAENVNFSAFPIPRLYIDHLGVGAPGSIFSITGEDFPVNQTAQLYVNAIYHPTDALRTDDTGTVSFSINTEHALPGYYMVTVTAYPTQAFIWLRLDEDGVIWQDADPTISLIPTTSPWSMAFLPSILGR